MFSAGVSLLTMTIRSAWPFNRPEDEAYKLVCRGGVAQLFQQFQLQVDPELVDLLNRLFAPFHLRPTVEEVLQHPYVRRAQPQQQQQH